jgi:hypothetical protein
MIWGQQEQLNNAPRLERGPFRICFGEECLIMNVYCEYTIYGRVERLQGSDCRNAQIAQGFIVLAVCAAAFAASFFFIASVKPSRVWLVFACLMALGAALCGLISQSKFVESTDDNNRPDGQRNWGYVDGFVLNAISWVGCLISGVFTLPLGWGRWGAEQHHDFYE